MAKTLSLVIVFGAGLEGDCTPFEPERRVEEDTGEGGTGAATTERVGVPLDLPRRAGSTRGELDITVKRGESCSERKRVASLESGNANLYYQDILHIAEFFPVIFRLFYCDKGSHKNSQCSAPTNLREHGAAPPQNTNAQEADRSVGHMGAPRRGARHRTHAYRTAGIEFL